MNDPTKRNVLYVITVGCALALIAYLGDFRGGGVSILADGLPSSTVEGEVLSIETGTKNSSGPATGYAVVKLRDGETVRASLGACVVFPGQMTRLAKYGVGSAAFYLVTESGKNDG